MALSASVTSSGRFAYLPSDRRQRAEVEQKTGLASAAAVSLGAVTSGEGEDELAAEEETDWAAVAASSANAAITSSGTSSEASSPESESS